MSAKKPPTCLPENAKQPLQAKSSGQAAPPVLLATEAALRHPALLQCYLRPLAARGTLSRVSEAAAAAADAATTELLAWLLSWQRGTAPNPEGLAAGHCTRCAAPVVAQPAGAAADGSAIAALCSPYLLR